MRIALQLENTQYWHCVENNGLNLYCYQPLFLKCEIYNFYFSLVTSNQEELGERDMK
jgi:hypothetical protein